MTNKDYNPEDKWGAPTSSYEDAKTMSNFLENSSFSPPIISLRPHFSHIKW